MEPNLDQVVHECEDGDGRKGRREEPNEAELNQNLVVVVESPCDIAVAVGVEVGRGLLLEGMDALGLGCGRGLAWQFGWQLGEVIWVWIRV